MNRSYGHMNPRYKMGEGSEKRCVKCGRVLPIDAFYVNSRDRRLRQCWCIECTKVASSNSAMRRAAKMRGATVIETFSRADLYERDGGICHVCGEPVDPDRWDVDHLTPLALGGQHTLDNVAVSHPACNGGRRVAPMAPVSRRPEQDAQLGLFDGRPA